MTASPDESVETHLRHVQRRDGGDIPLAAVATAADGTTHDCTLQYQGDKVTGLITSSGVAYRLAVTDDGVPTLEVA